MKRLLEIIILFLILINPLKADDIQSFEIDGMSIGDSLLKYFNEKEINNSIKTEYASKKFAGRFSWRSSRFFCRQTIFPCPLG